MVPPDNNGMTVSPVNLNQALATFTEGAILMFEPSGTSTTGDRHEGEIPAYVDSTTGRDISG